MWKWPSIALVLLASGSFLALILAMRESDIAAHLDSHAVGTVVTSETAGRGNAFIMEAEFWVDGARYVAHPGSDNHGHNTENTPLKSAIDVYYDSSDPTKSSFSPSGDAAKAKGVAKLLCVVTLLLALFVVFRWRQHRRA